jgi:hypothetical protein
VCVCVCVCVCVRACVVCVCVCVCEYICVYRYIYVYIDTYIYVHTHTETNNLNASKRPIWTIFLFSSFFCFLPERKTAANALLVAPVTLTTFFGLFFAFFCFLPESKQAAHTTRCAGNNGDFPAHFVRTPSRVLTGPTEKKNQ